MKLSTSLLLLLLPGLTACATGSSDQDGDFLSDEFEALIGSRRDLRDSDGDGYTDSEEHLTYYDATSGSDHPTDSNYPRLALPDEIEATGWNLDDVSDTWERDDQDENEIELHDFYGNVIVIATLAEYVETAQDDALEHQDAYEEFADRGFMVIHLLVDGDPEDTAPDPAGWASDFGLEFAIIDDSSQTLINAYVDMTGPKFTIPSYTVIGRDMVIRDHDNTDPFNTDLIEDLLDEPVPEVTTWPLPANVLELRAELDLRRIVDDEENLDHKLVAADMNASLDGDLASSVGDNAFSPVDSEGNASGTPFGGTDPGCGAGSMAFTLFPLLLLPPLRRRR
jgi:peroxiredoxin